MKSVFKSLVAAAALAVSSVAAHAADWTPPGPIKLMIAFAAGGGADTQARLIAEELEGKLGWKFIPEQVTGKGGVNLLAAMKGQPTDGTVIGMVVTESMGYNLRTADAGMTPADFTPIATTAGFQMGVVAPASKGWKTMADVFAAAKAGKELRFGTMSPRLSDLAFLLGQANDVDFNIVQVRGGRAVMDGVNAGDMDLGFMAGIQAKGVAAGELVNLASALSQPLAQTPEAPLFKDLGMEFTADGYFMFTGPGGMDTAARDAIADAIEAAVSTEGTKPAGLINKAFGGPTVIKGDALADLVNADFEAAGALLKAASE